jgi:molybdenum cofactor cytidylyltransferase
MTGVLVLAAGESRRMGRPKQLLPYRGSTLLRHAAETALATALGPVLVVLGAEAELCRQALAALNVRTVLNPAWAEGMSASISAGMSELEQLAPQSELDGVLILLHDQPAIPANRLVDLVAARQTDDRIVASCYGNVTGVPAWFHRELFAELRQLRGPQGARAMIEAHATRVRRFEMPEAAFDIDTPEDYQRLGGQSRPLTT